MILTPERLMTVCEPFDFANQPFDPIEFSKDLVRTMIDNMGLGLAANQVGAPYRIFALFTQPENTVCFNPVIVDEGDEKIVLDEGCLSYPGLVVKVKRSKSIKVRFARPNGEVVTEKYTGITARAFQHEMDHLDGVIFFNRANRVHRETALRKWRSKK